MRNTTLRWLIAFTLLAAAGLIALTAVLVPEHTHPAYAVAVEFMNAAGAGDNAAASALLSDGLRAYVAENCPQASVSACVDAYTPPEWGDLIRAVYRRSIPDGDRAFDVLLVATYQEDVGFSGVCIYHRVEETAPDDWRVTAWAGFLHCEEPAAEITRLRRADAVNRAP
jgi:hypothetical protein